MTPWTAACQASLSLTISLSFMFMSIASMMPSNHLILWWSSSLSALSLSQHLGLFRWIGYSHKVTKILQLQLQHQSFQPVFSIVTGLISLLSKGLSGVFCSTTVQRHQFFGTPPSLQFRCHNSTWPGEDHSLDYMDLCWQSNVSAFQYTFSP